MVKNLPANTGDVELLLGLGRSPGASDRVKPGDADFYRKNLMSVTQHHTSGITSNKGCVYAAPKKSAAHSLVQTTNQPSQINSQ